MGFDREMMNSSHSEAIPRIIFKKVIKARLIYGISWSVLAIVIWIALCFGSVDADWYLIEDLRLPRVVLAGAIGIGLSVAGAVMQVLFSNPLCEPYVLGISSGSALGVVMGNVLGITLNFGGLAGCAFLGALTFAGLIFWVSHFRMRAELRQSHTFLLLVGVALGFLGNSLLALWIAVAEPGQLQSATAWFFGDLSHARFSGALISLVAVIVISLIVFSQSRQMDALLLGEDEAISIGVDRERLQKMMIGLTSVLVGICVAGGGVIGFIGLLVPHGVRLWVGATHRRLLPLCGIWGAITLIFADFLSRWLARPYELPVGVVTALIGSPVLIWTLLKRAQGASS